MIGHNNQLQIGWLLRSLQRAVAKKSIVIPGDSLEVTKCSNRKQTGNGNNAKSRTDDIFSRQKVKSASNPPKVSENCLVLRKTLGRQKKIFGFDDNSTNFVENILGKLSKVYFSSGPSKTPPSLSGCPNPPTTADSSSRCSPCPPKKENCAPACPPGGKNPPKPKYPPCPAEEPKSKCPEKPKYPSCPEPKPQCPEKPSPCSDIKTPESKPKCPPEKPPPCSDKKTPEPKSKCPPEKPSPCSGKTPEPKCPPKKPSPCSGQKIPESKPKCPPEKPSPCSGKTPEPKCPPFSDKKSPSSEPKCPPKNPSPCSGQKIPESKPKCPPKKPSPCSDKTPKPKCPPKKPSPCSGKKTPEPKCSIKENPSPCSSGKVIKKSNPPAKSPNNSGKSRKCPPCPSIKKCSSLLQIPTFTVMTTCSYSCSKSGNMRKGKCRTSKGASDSRDIFKKNSRENVEEEYGKSPTKLRKVCIKRSKNRRRINDLSRKSTTKL